MPPRRSSKQKSQSVEPEDNDAAGEEEEKEEKEKEEEEDVVVLASVALNEKNDEDDRQIMDSREELAREETKAIVEMNETKPGKSAGGASQQQRQRQEQQKQRTKVSQKTQTQKETFEIDESNRLKRDSAFLCPMQFRNNLPPPRAHDWKLLRKKGSIDDDLAEHNVACLYDELRRSTRMFPEDLGINLDPIGSDAYRAFKVKGEIHEDDLILLATDSGRDKERMNQAGREPDVSKAMWLMNTKYISEGGLSLKTGISEKSNLILKRQKALALKEHKEVYASEREKQIAAIKKSFEAAEKLTMRTAVHPRNKDLKPVSVKSVFPDFKKWPQNFVRLTFDEDPTLDVEGVSSASDLIKEKAMQKAIVKPMMVEDESGRPDKFIALMLPKDAKNAENVRIYDENENENGTEYEWIREYKYAVKTEEINTVCFYFGKDQVTYADLNTKISCQKKAKTAKGRDGEAWKPVSVHVKKRNRTEDEDDNRAQKLSAIE